MTDIEILESRIERLERAINAMAKVCETNATYTELLHKAVVALKDGAATRVLHS